MILSKTELRRRVKAATLDFISEGDVAEAERAIWNAVQALPQYREAKTVLVYSSLPDEVSTADFIRNCSKRVVLPVVEGDHLLLREYDPGHMVPGYRGILEPGPEAVAVRPDEIDFAIIPGVAFTRDGWRLGRGKGYYDRLLPQIRGCKVGVCFATQIVEEIPLDPWDEKLDMTIFG